jgi:vacuolar-type H+-ATPase subunit E/Vma4
LLPGALDLDAYRKSLPAVLGGALAALGEGPVVIRCTPAIRPLLETLERPAGTSVVSDDTVGNGFLVQATDGSVDAVDTLEERLERRRTELTRRMFEQLGVDA